MSQLGLHHVYDADAGDRARDEAIARVARYREWWIGRVVEAIRDLASMRQTFTTDAVWYVLDAEEIESPNEPRAMGAAIRRAVKLGLIEDSGEKVKSVRAECHRRPITVWRSR